MRALPFLATRLAEAAQAELARGVRRRERRRGPAGHRDRVDQRAVPWRRKCGSTA